MKKYFALFVLVIPCLIFGIIKTGAATGENTSGNSIQTVTGEVTAQKSELLDGDSSGEATWQEVEDFIGAKIVDYNNYPQECFQVVNDPSETCGNLFLGGNNYDTRSKLGQQALAIMNNLGVSHPEYWIIYISLTKAGENKLCSKMWETAPAYRTIDDCIEFKMGGAGQRICSHQNTYNYTFHYLANKGEWTAMENKVNKCEELKLSFSPIADFAASLEEAESQPGLDFSNYYNQVVPHIPPTDILECAGQEDCLNKANEYSVAPDVLARGAQQVPAGFIETTQQSLSSADANIECANGICIPYASGHFTLSATAPESTYFGQCKKGDTVINTDGTNIPAVSSSAQFDVANRPPVATVSIAKDPIFVNEEVNVTCDIVDPDDCVDKIAKVKWACTDSAGQSRDCYLSGGSTGMWNQGSAEQILTSLEKSNPYRATAKFKATQTGAYAITCEAWDDDAANPLSGTGMDGVSVIGAEPGVIAAKAQFCSVISDSENDKTICGESGSAEYLAYSYNIEAQKYQWDCGNNQKETTDSPKINCQYDQKGPYVPSLTILDTKGESHKCEAQASVNITDESKCEIGARINGTSNNYENNLNVESGAQVEAKVSRQCLDGGTVSWLVPGGTIMSRNKDTAIIKFSGGGSQEIKAGINKDGKTTDCGKVELKVKEEVKFGL